MEGILSKIPQPSGNSNKASHISLNFLVLQNAPPTGNSNPFGGGSVDIFWTCTLLERCTVRAKCQYSSLTGL